MRKLAICRLRWWKRYAVSLIMVSAIVVLSLYPLALPEPITDVPFYDKWGHFLMYAVLTLVIWLEYAHAHRQPGHALPASLPAYSWWRLLVCGGVMPALFGGLMELLQATCTTTRAGEWADFLADAIGVLLGIVLAAAVLRLVRSQQP